MGYGGRRYVCSTQCRREDDHREEMSDKRRAVAELAGKGKNCRYIQKTDDAVLVERLAKAVIRKNWSNASSDPMMLKKRDEQH